MAISVPDPPSIVSLPAPPVTVSLPNPRVTVSLPLPRTTTSSPLVPLVSEPSPPVNIMFAFVSDVKLIDQVPELTSTVIDSPADPACEPKVKGEK